jgi:hypothetical protein
MKNIIFPGIKLFAVSTVIILCLSEQMSGQSDSLVNPKQFLFPSFSKGTVAMKTSKDIFLVLNYNIATEKMVFIQKGKLFELMNPEAVDTIYLNDRKFVLIGKTFQEVIDNRPVLLFVQHKGIVQPPAKKDPYGTASQTSATTSYSDLKVGSIVYDFNDPGLIIKRETIYRIIRNNEMVSFKDATQLVRIFPDNKDEIRNYIKQNKTKFENPEDIVKLITFCNSLVKI